MGNLAEKIIIQGKKIGFDLVGIIAPVKLHEYEVNLKSLQESGYLSPFIGDAPEQRLNPEVLLPGAKAIVMVGLAYHGATQDNHRKLHGKLASSARGEDYHHKISIMLENLAAKIVGMTSVEFNYKIFVDNKPILEKAMAVKAGFGFLGKNSLLINPKLGSYIFLGGLITDLELAELPEVYSNIEQSEKTEEFCSTCNQCITSCPTQAIVAPGVIDTRRCLAQITQNKGIVPLVYREKLAFSLYGCDICQQTCPYNITRSVFRGANHEDHGEIQIDLQQLLDLNKSQFASTIGKTAAGWRGKTVLQRNAVIALGNWGDQKAVPLLNKALTDQRPVIRIHAAWALKKIGGEKTQELLKKALQKEKNPQVLEEINLAMIELNK